MDIISFLWCLELTLIFINFRTSIQGKEMIVTFCISQRGQSKDCVAVELGNHYNLNKSVNLCDLWIMWLACHQNANIYFRWRPTLLASNISDCCRLSPGPVSEVRGDGRDVSRARDGGHRRVPGQKQESRNLICVESRM